MAFHKLRNKLNRGRKKPLAKYYDAKVKQRGSCAPATWWNEIRRSSCIFEHVSRRGDTVSMLSNIECNSELPPPLPPSVAELATEINQTILRPMADFTWQNFTFSRN